VCDVIEERFKAEDSLNHLARKLKDKETLTQAETEIAELWQMITFIRNDINHAGMRKNPLPFDKAITNIKEVCQKTITLLAQV